MSSIWTIRRSATDSKVAGVCGGIAQHWNVDPVLVRVGCAMLALSGGIGVVLYVAGWLLVPVEGRDDAPIHDLLGPQARRWSREVWLALVVIACILTFGLLNSLSPFGFGPAVILAVIWYFGYYKTRARSTARATQPPPSPPPPPQTPHVEQPRFSYPGPPTAFTEAAEAWRQRIAEHEQAMTGPPPAAPAYVRSQPAEDRTEPVGLANPLPAAATAHAAYLSHPDPVGLYTPGELTQPPSLRPARSASLSARRLRLVGLAVLGLALSGLGVADGLGVHVPLAAYFAVALAVVGLTLVAATWFGRARGILPVGFLLLLAVVSTTATAHVGPVASWGNPPLAYTTLADLPATGDTIDVGNLSVDLSKLDVTRDATYRAHVDLGMVDVTVPANANVVITYAVDSGTITAFGKRVGGSSPRGTLRPDLVRPGAPTLTLDLSADVGSVEVRR